MRVWITVQMLAFTLLMLLGPTTDSAHAKLPLKPCAVASGHTHGCVLTAIYGPGTPGPAARGPRIGRACAWNILRLVSWGDVRVKTAMAKGRVTEISSVDYEMFELIPYYGVFSAYCTVVSGQ
jgi:hypothetical protein